MNWSIEQLAIFDWFEIGECDLVVRARAGTGKTTTIIEGVKHAPERSVLLCAFSKIIEQELTKRLAGTDRLAKTLHGVGYACVRKFRTGIKVDFSSDRADALAAKVCGAAAPSAIVKLVSKLHTKGREIVPHATRVGELSAIQIQFECEPEEQWNETQFNTAYVESKALEAMELAADVKDGATIDGSDMIFLPVRNGWLTKQYDLVVVDEAQDMTTAQLEIAQGVCRGRICVVGDDRQAIFGFRGADSGSLDRLKSELGATELGLKVTYRCGRAIVAEAQRFVPDFVAGGSHEGTVSYLPAHKLVAAAAPGDFILSRVNAPLVSTAMQLLRAGKRARVAGRDIGAGLISLIRKFKASSVPNLLARISAWETREVSRVTAQMNAATNGRRAAFESKIDGLRDQAAMLTSLCDGARNVEEVHDRVTALFSDDGQGVAGMVTLSSVHRAKGLEANRVFVLADTLRETSEEERNICYVAVTRAKNELVYVVKETPADMRSVEDWQEVEA